MSGFRSGERSPEDSEQGQLKTLDVESATPDEVIEHFREDPLYADLYAKSERSGSPVPEERRTELLEGLAQRTDGVLHCARRQAHHTEKDPAHPYARETDAFLREHGVDPDTHAGMEPALQELAYRWDIFRRSYQDALAVRQELMIKGLDKGKN